MRTIAIAAVAGLLSMATGASAQTIVDVRPAELTDVLMTGMFATVTEGFRDPYSAQFRRISLRGQGPNICGEVNARNGFGAYVGFIPFFYSPTRNEATLYDATNEILRNLTFLTLSYSGCAEALGVTAPPP